MDLRLCSLLFVLTLPLVAQVQDPPATTPADELTALQQEKERLLREIDYVKNRVSNAKDLLTKKFERRSLSVRAIDAGQWTLAAQPTTPQVAPRHARLMQSDELAIYGDDVMMLVSGTPISRTLFNQLVAHQGDQVPADVRGQMAVYELIRTEGTAAEFTESDVEGLLQEITTKLAAGKTVAELVPTYGTLPGAAEDGRIEVTRNSRFGPRLEQLAFSSEVGATTRPFRHHGGVVVLHKVGVEKGASPELDKVIAHALHVPYSNDPAQLQKAQVAISSAQIEIVVRDKATMMLLPMMFRDAEYRTPAGPAGDEATMQKMEVLQKSLAVLQEEIERAQASDSEIDQGRVKMLETRRARLEEEIKQLSGRLEAGDDPDKSDADAEPKPEQGNKRKNPN